MPLQAAVGKIRCPADWFKDVAVVQFIRLWYHGHYGSLWDHPSTVISILTGYGNISITIQNPGGRLVPITVSWSSWSIEVDDSWLNSGVSTIYVSFLNGFKIPIEYFINPPILVVGNDIWYRSSVPIIWLLGIIFPKRIDH